LRENLHAFAARRSHPHPLKTAVTWLSFIVFCVFVGAVAGPDWVKGGIEFDDGTGKGSNNNLVRKENRESPSAPTPP
jgi:hypothetical protein